MRARWIGLGALVAGCATEPSLPPARPVAPPGGPTPARLAGAAPAATAAARVPAPSGIAPAGTARWLKGQTHVHSSGSYDSTTPPDEVLRFYAERGYAFVALTDHNRVTAAVAPPGLLLVPGVELTQSSASCEPKPRPGWRCLFHTTALFVDPARDPARGARFRPPFVAGRLEAYSAQLALAAELGGIAVLNHPHFHFAADGRTVTALARRGLGLLEIANAALDTRHPGGRDAAEARGERLWDEVLSAGALVYGIASDDAHHFSDADARRRQHKSAHVGDRAWIVAHAAPTPASLRAALVGGRFYASTGVALDALEATPERVRVAVAGPQRVRVRFVGRGARQLAVADGPVAEYLPRGDEGYVRAVVSDARGRKAWLQPVRIP
jgi:hypothetical protein